MNAFLGVKETNLKKFHAKYAKLDLKWPFGEQNGHLESRCGFWELFSSFQGRDRIAIWGADVNFGNCFLHFELEIAIRSIISELATILGV